MKMSHMVVFMWKELGITKEQFFGYWFPFLNMVLKRYQDLYNKKKDSGNSVDVDDMDINQIRHFFTSRGIPVRSNDDG